MVKEQPDPQHSQRWRLKHPVDWLWCIYPRGGFFFLFFCFVLRFSPGCKCHRKDDEADAVPPVTENKLAGLHFFFFSFVCIYSPCISNPGVFWKTSCNIFQRFWGLHRNGTPEGGLEFWVHGSSASELQSRHLQLLNTSLRTPTTRKAYNYLP